MATSAHETKLVKLDDLRRFVSACFLAENVPKYIGESLCEMLLDADSRGHFSHGLSRLEFYLSCIRNRSVDIKSSPRITKDAPAVALVEGHNALGVVVGNFCMDLAIKKARENGIGFVCARDSNHYGAAGYYALRAMREGFIGMSMTNSRALMPPTNGKEALLGSNPIAFGAGVGEDQFLLDMALTTVAIGKLEILKRKSVTLPPGWALDDKGQITTNPEIALKAGLPLPLGGDESTGGYKGYGLAAMVDILCGVMTGANYLNKLPKWSPQGQQSPIDLGHIFIAINPTFFAPGFEKRLLEFNNRLRNTEPVDPEQPVLIPGDKSSKARKEVEESGGIHYALVLLDAFDAIAEHYRIRALTRL